MQSQRAAAFLFVLLLVMGVVNAQASSMDALEQYFSEVQTLSGRFVQETMDSTGGVIETAEGEFLIARPDRFRWDYALPYEQQIVADGRQLWVYDIDLDQVVVRPVDEALGVGAAQLLSGDIQSLQASFDIEQGDAGALLLTPVDPAWAFQQIRLQLRQGVPERMEIADGMGQTVVVEFYDVVVNPDIPDQEFEFVAPAHVDVIEG